MTRFHQITPSLDCNWRSLILFGRNVASYKFALGKTLLECSTGEATQLSLEQLAPTFARNVCEHLLLCDKQSTSPTSSFLDTCRRFNQGEIAEDQLIATTVRKGFNNVIDAFHVVNQHPLETRFYTDDRKQGGGITLTDELFKLHGMTQGASLNEEIEARWRLVETAWSLNMSRNLISVEADSDENVLYVRGDRRIDITSSRGALNGYQKGRCFYCFDEVSISDGADQLADVDHFFPWILKREGFMPDADGVWNLVLACRSCNRGQEGKFAKVPTASLVERLYQRNRYLIDSHHPLRETLIKQTGNSDEERRAFLQGKYKDAIEVLIHDWEPTPRGPSAF